MRFNEEPKIEVGTHTRAHFLMGIPTLGMVPIEFVVAFGRLQMPVNAKVQSMIVTKTEVGVARNHVVEFALSMQQKPEYIFFLGDDMLPPWDGLIKLHQEMMTGKWDVLAGIYFIKQDLPIPIIWRRDVIGYLEPYKHYQPGEVVNCDVVGMDFTMIKTSIFEKLEKPWFKTGPTEYEGNLVTHTEDVWFADLVKANGFKIGCHTGVRVGHLDIKQGEVY